MTQLTDYYRELNIPVSANEQEIKKAFRKLAMQYHPDKNNGGLAAAEKFKKIQEAYQVLSDKTQRAAYHYRYFSEKNKNVYRKEIHTVDDLLAVTTKLQKDITAADPFRTDTELLYFEIDYLLSDKNLSLLENCSDQTAINTVIQNICIAARVLRFPMIKAICRKLERLVPNDESAKRKLEIFIREAKQVYYWNRYKMFFALLVALILSAIIFFSKK